MKELVILLIHYTCISDLLPMVEAALAANGYIIEAPPQKQLNGNMLMVMTSGSAGVLLSQNGQDELADIEVWGAAQSAAAALLESLPIELRKQPQDPTLARYR
jgi:hypothetical protein